MGELAFTSHLRLKFEPCRKGMALAMGVSRIASIVFSLSLALGPRIVHADTVILRSGQRHDDVKTRPSGASHIIYLRDGRSFIIPDRRQQDKGLADGERQLARRLGHSVRVLTLRMVAPPARHPTCRRRIRFDERGEETERWSQSAPKPPHLSSTLPLRVCAPFNPIRNSQFATRTSKKLIPAPWHRC
ncbi:MAG: hypothetical protein HC888_14885 [Candidatus Competibacteraceae bacterium]|nr:hypothetical protein [Candidatus Competibacteraceae bacterium]